MNNRTLKVRKGHWDYIPKRTPSSGNRVAPFILLKGLWLEQAGFSIDTPVLITVEGGRLAIDRIVAAEAERRASESFEALPPNARSTGKVEAQRKLCPCACDC